MNAVKKTKWQFMVFTVLMVTLLSPLTISATGQNGPAKPEEVMEITLMYRYKDSNFLHELGEKFNVRIVSNGIYSSDHEKVQVLIASGEMPDTFGYYNPLDRLQDDNIRGIPLDMIKEYMHNYAKILDENPLGWLINKHPDKENEYLAITGITANIDGPVFLPSFRIDWARNVGVDLPNYESKKISLDEDGRCYFLDEDLSLDWFEKLMVAFRDGDPDGNGKLDTIPMMASADKRYTWGPVLGAFGITFYPTEFWREGVPNYEEDGEIYLSAISPRYKEFLTLAAKWYRMGFVDKEWPTMNRQQAWDKVGAHKIGVAFSNAVSSIGIPSRPPSAFSTDEEVQMGGEVVLLPPPVGPRGLQGVQAGSANGSIFNPGCFFVNKKVSDEKLIKILQILDYVKFTEEGFISYFYGKPGIHFEWQGEPWNSPGIRKDVNEIPKDQNIKDASGYEFSMLPYAYTVDKIKLLYPKKINDFWQSYIFGKRGKELSVNYYRWDLFNETKLSELQESYGVDLTTITNEFYSKAITGDIDIDTEWNSYVEQWRKSGGDEILVEMRKSPIVSEIIEGRIAY